MDTEMELSFPCSRTTLQVEYKIGDRVKIEYDPPGCYIHPYSQDNFGEGKEVFSGTVTCIIAPPTTDINPNMVPDQKKKFGIDRIEAIIKKEYAGKLIYCVHLDDYEDFGSDYCFNYPWWCTTHCDDTLCSNHWPDGRSSRKDACWVFSCYLAAVVKNDGHYI